MSELAYLPVEELVPWDDNPRHNADAAKALAKAIQEVGFGAPIVVQAQTNRVIAGHTRLKAAKQLGLQTLPAHVLDISDRDAKKMALADNRLGELAGWDYPSLAHELSDFSLEEAETLGFDSKYLEDLADKVADFGPLNSSEVVEDEVPEPPKDPVTKPGDVWTLGRHTVACGDCRLSGLARVSGIPYPDAVVTDPPYGIDYNYNRHDDSEASWFTLMDDVVPMLRGLAQVVVMPCCQIKRLGWWYKSHAPDWVICWYKGSPGHQSAIGFNDWEPHLIWGKPPHPMHDYFATRCGFEVQGHPCPKPVAWAAWLLERVTEKRGIVLDPFLGSGTTLVAAEQLGRTCHGYEIDPIYCDVIVDRWESLTGGKATRKAAGV